MKNCLDCIHGSNHMTDKTHAVNCIHPEYTTPVAKVGYGKKLVPQYYAEECPHFEEDPNKPDAMTQAAQVLKDAAKLLKT